MHDTLLYLVIAFIFAGAAAGMSALFIQKNNGNGMTKSALVFSFFIWLLFTLAWWSKPQHVYDTEAYFILMFFCLSFILLDMTNHWLPVEFTLPFCGSGALVQFCQGDAVNHLSGFLGMLTLLTLVRLFLNWRYRCETFGKGDVWMVSGMSIWSGFYYTAIALSAGLAIFIIWCMVSRLFAAKKRTEVAFPLAPAVCFTFLFITVIQPIQGI